MKSFSIILVFIWISIANLITNKNRCQFKTLGIIRANYDNVISLYRTIISTRKINTFQDNYQGVMLNALYPLPNTSVYCSINRSIIFDLVQNYQTNQLLIWLFDNDNRQYNFVVYGFKQNMKKILIYECTNAQKIQKISFKPNNYSHFQLFNRGGNTLNGNLNIRKVLAYYKF